MESGKMAAIESPGSRRAHSKYFMFLLDTESGEATAGKRAADERRWLRSCEKNASIARLTDKSVCPWRHAVQWHSGDAGEVSWLVLDRGTGRGESEEEWRPGDGRKRRGDLD